MARHVLAEEAQLQGLRLKAMAEAGKAIAADEKARQAQAKAQASMNKADLDYLKIVDEIGGAEQRHDAIERLLAVHTLAEVTTVKHLTAAYSEYLLVKQDALRVGESFTQSIKAEVAAVQEDMLGSVANLTEGLAGLIGGQKAAAVFKAGYEVAEGIACLASGTWPPNPAAIIAAGLHFEAAAQYALMGGGGGGGRHSAGAGGNQSSYGGSGGGGGVSSASPGGGGGSGSRGPTVILNQYGPMVGSMADLAKAMVPVLNQLGTSGQVRLTAYNALTNGAKQT
jgi:hypothetical protein